MIRDHWSCETSMRECNTGDKHQGTGELIKTFWCPLIMHTHCRAPLLTTTCDSEQELRASHRGREATQHFSWSGNYSWLIYIFIRSGVFCPVIRSHQISGAGVSRPSAGEQWSCRNWKSNLTWILMQPVHQLKISRKLAHGWHELRHQASVGGRSSGVKWCSRSRLGGGECGWSERGGHVSRVISHHTLLSATLGVGGDTRGQMIPADKARTGLRTEH